MLGTHIQVLQLLTVPSLTVKNRSHLHTRQGEKSDTRFWYVNTTECYTAGKTNPSTWLNSKTTMREQKEATEDHTHFKTHKTTLCPA